tara:strand:- start:146 stop:562 length:417 start_codon:yes stop_codon:yes gene_type:complete
MEYVGFVKETYKSFKNIRDSRRLHMLNLVELKEEAIYPDGHVTTGLEAYLRYGKESEPVFKKLGGSIVWRGDMLIGLIGPTDEKWDICFIAEYPSVESFVLMQRDKIYQKAVVHRQIAVKTSRLIRMAPSETGENFAF